MATDKDSNSPENKPDEGGVFSLEDIDQLLEEVDPEFAKSMGKLEADKEVGEAEVAEFEDSAETDAAPSHSVKERIIKKVKWGVETSTDWVFYGFIKAKKASKIAVKVSQKNVTAAATRAKTELPERIKYVKSKTKNESKEKWMLFKGLSLSRKIWLFAFMAIIGVGAVLVQQTWRGGWLPSIHVPLVANFAEVADHKYTYNPRTEMRLFQEAFPHKEFTVQLKRTVFNLLRHPKSGPNPMAYVELYVGTTLQGSAVEIKDRESEFLDLIRRVGEDFTYEDLKGFRGKERFKTKVAGVLNEHLNVGLVKRVYIKEVVIKP